jgi:hypothetical protein
MVCSVLLISKIGRLLGEMHVRWGRGFDPESAITEYRVITLSKSMSTK